MRYQPLDDRVLVQPKAAADTTAGGIVIPDQAQDKPFTGTVIAAGPGLQTDTGERIPMALEVGDEVVYSRYAGTELKLDGESFVCLTQRDVLLVDKATVGSRTR